MNTLGSLCIKAGDNKRCIMEGPHTSSVWRLNPELHWFHVLTSLLTGGVSPSIHWVWGGNKSRMGCESHPHTIQWRVQENTAPLKVVLWCLRFLVCRNVCYISYVIREWEYTVWGQILQPQNPALPCRQTGRQTDSERSNKDNLDFVVIYIRFWD